VLFLLYLAGGSALQSADFTVAAAHNAVGKPVDESYVVFFLLVVLLVGFYSDVIGTNSFHGELMLGLAIPNGSPLGIALGEKIDAMVSGLILSLYYAMTGLNTDVWSLHWGRLQLVVLCIFVHII
jgi:Kef-type K+ transport system membrane component KefB